MAGGAEEPEGSWEFASLADRHETGSVTSGVEGPEGSWESASDSGPLLTERPLGAGA